MASTAIIGIGSNRRHGRHGSPRAVVRAAVEAMRAAGLAVEAVSRLHDTPPLGPSDRRFANAAVRVRTDLSPPALLALVKRIERDFGRRPGRRWGARVLDLDILALTGPDGVVPGRLRWRQAARGGAASLRVPHAGLHRRGFALRPLIEVAPRWRHPVLALSARALAARLARRR